MISASILLAAALAQDVSWKSSWSDGLKAAKESNSIAVLLFFNAGLKDCRKFDEETLPDARVNTALKKFVCVRIDPEVSDADNKLWQEHKMPRPPMTFLYEPEGKLLTSVSSLNPKYYAEALENAGPAFFERIVPARQAIASDASTPAPHASLGEAYAKLNNPQESVASYAKAASAHEQRGDKKGAIDLLVGQLQLYYGMKWYGHARPCGRKLLELDPANGSGKGAMAAWVLGMADCDDKKWADAINGLEPACKKYKDSDILDKMMFSLGSAYMYSKQTDKAISVFEEIIAKFPDSETANIARIQVEKLKK